MGDQRIKNKKYREFLDAGIISTYSEQEITALLLQITGNNIREGRALVICAYYTGARPVEYLRLLSTDIAKIKSYISIKIPPAKNGLARTPYLQSKKPLVKELYEYAISLPPNAYLFPSFKNKYLQKHINKKGELIFYERNSSKVWYWFKKWGFDTPPYFQRHNRFSKLAEEGGSENEIRLLKGCKSLSSAIPYIHLSKRNSESLAKKIN